MDRKQQLEKQIQVMWQEVELFYSTKFMDKIQQLENQIQKMWQGFEEGISVEKNLKKKFGHNIKRIALVMIIGLTTLKVLMVLMTF